MRVWSCILLVGIVSTLYGESAGTTILRHKDYDSQGGHQSKRISSDFESEVDYRSSVERSGKNGQNYKRYGYDRDYDRDFESYQYGSGQGKYQNWDRSDQGGVERSETRTRYSTPYNGGHNFGGQEETVRYSYQERGPNRQGSRSYEEFGPRSQQYGSYQGERGSSHFRQSESEKFDQDYSRESSSQYDYRQGGRIPSGRPSNGNNWHYERHDYGKHGNHGQYQQHSHKNGHHSSKPTGGKYVESVSYDQKEGGHREVTQKEVRYNDKIRGAYPH